jgi:hypothetical protein
LIFNERGVGIIQGVHQLNMMHASGYDIESNAGSISSGYSGDKGLINSHDGSAHQFSFVDYLEESFKD